jgi:hypothetical protein
MVIASFCLRLTASQIPGFTETWGWRHAYEPLREKERKAGFYRLTGAVLL